MLVAFGRPILGLFVMTIFYLSGVGVRERSRYAAGCAFVFYFGDMLVSGPGGIRLFLAALLLSNFRATWIAARWMPDSEEAAPQPRWSETWTDKFADQFPMWLWPKVRIIYYVLSAFYFALLVFGIIVIFSRRG